MKILIIGGSGHYSYALDEAEKNEELQIVGLAPGVAGEDLTSILKHPLMKGVPLFSDYREAIETAEPDVVVNNTWFGRSWKVTAESIEKGIPVFAEKPLAGTLDKLSHLRDKLEKNPTPLCAMFGLRFTPEFSKLAEMCRDGVLGDIRLITAQKSYKLGIRPDFYTRRESYTGTIPWVGSHGVDWIYHLCGRKFKRIWARHSSSGSPSGELELTALCSYEMEDGILATLTMDYLRPDSALSHDDDRIRVAGTGGVAEIRRGRLYLIDRQGEREIQTLPVISCFADFIDSLKQGSRAGVTTGESLYITEICLQSREAADTGRTITLIDESGRQAQ